MTHDVHQPLAVVDLLELQWVRTRPIDPTASCKGKLVQVSEDVNTLAQIIPTPAGDMNRPVPECSQVEARIYFALGLAKLNYTSYKPERVHARPTCSTYLADLDSLRPQVWRIPRGPRMRARKFPTNGCSEDDDKRWSRVYIIG